MKSNLRVLSNIVDDGGCGYFRTRWPFAAMRRNGIMDNLIMEKDWDDASRLRNIRDADIIVSRPRSELLVWKLKSWIEYKTPEVDTLQLKKKKFVFDIDDNTFEISPFNDQYKNLGTEEVEVTLKGKKQWLWKDGENGFDLKGNRAWRDSLIGALEDHDLITTTTPYFAEFLKQFNDNVVVLPNCIDFEMYRALEFKEQDEVRIIWAGGASHFEDWETIAEPIGEIFKKYKNVKLVLAGNWFKGNLRGVPENRIEKHGWVKTIGHPYHLATLRGDIAIIPLKDTVFNHYKSELKFSEFSALKIPSVVANVLPYSPVCKDGVNSLCYNNSKEFVQKLSKLIEDRALRKKISDGAYKWVKANRDLDKNAHLWQEAYATCYTGIQKASPPRIITPGL